jgi:hypothetical protein
MRMRRRGSDLLSSPAMRVRWRAKPDGGGV